MENKLIARSLPNEFLNEDFNAISLHKSLDKDLNYPIFSIYRKDIDKEIFFMVFINNYEFYCVILNLNNIEDYYFLESRFTISDILHIDEVYDKAWKELYHELYLSVKRNKIDSHNEKVYDGRFDYPISIRKYNMSNFLDDTFECIEYENIQDLNLFIESIF